jgi:glucokinase
MSERNYVIGIDFGGSNFRGAIYEGMQKRVAARKKGAPLKPEDWQPAATHREPVGEPRDPETITERVGGVVEKLTQAVGARGKVPVGIGFAGMLASDDGKVAISPYMRWRDVDFGALLRKRLGAERPVRIENDVNAIAFGEYALGAAVGAHSVLAVFVGTGIGGGYVHEGRMVEGATFCAGEFGHLKVVFDRTARPCACGLSGCIEAYAGGDNLQKRIREELSGRKKSKALELAGSVDKLQPNHVDDAAAEGDEYAHGLWSEVGPMLGVTIANVTSFCNPSHVVLGGGVLTRTPVLKTYVAAAFQAAVNPPAGKDVILTDTLLGDEAGLIGSALLAAE